MWISDSPIRASARPEPFAVIRSLSLVILSEAKNPRISLRIKFAKHPGIPPRGARASRRGAAAAVVGRRFKAALLAFSAFCFLRPAFFSFAGVGQYQVKEIKPKVFVWVAEDILGQEGDPRFNRAGNAGFILTPEGVVVVDTTNTPFNARDLLYEIRQRTNLPVRYVIDTSGRADLALGNEVFEDFRPAILSTPETQAAIGLYRRELPARLNANWRLARTMRGIHPTLPTGTFSRTTTLPVSPEQIRLVPLGSNASPGDAAVFLPRARVVFLGDVFENAYVPRIGSGDVRHWIETLRQVESWNADVYVPAHGAPGGKRQVAEFRRFLEWLTNGVETRLRQGKSLEQIEKEMLPFPNHSWHAPELESVALEGVYRQLAAPKPPAAAASASASDGQK